MELLVNILVFAVIVLTLCVLLLILDRKGTKTNELSRHAKKERKEIDAEGKRKIEILRKQTENFYSYDGSEQSDPEQKLP